MKKIRIGILAVLLTGITGLAAANNPFTDVPEGHWAYNSINKLVDAGIIEGYNNGHYGGDRLITRYEMAQIVAKAMAKGADVDRLAAEFAEELDNLGIRVSNLEEQSDNVKITGEIRIADYAFKNSKSRSHDELRTRLFINGKINDQWEYGAMLENTQNFRNDSGDENTLFKRAYVQGNLNGVKITAGRQFFKSGYGFYAVATNIKALKVDVGNVLKASAFVGQFANMVTTKESNEKLYGLHLAYPVNKKIFAQAAYYHPEAIYDGNTVAYQKNDVYTVGLGYKFDKSTILYAEYLKADKPVLPEQGYSKAGWAAINSNTTGQRRMMLIISAYLMIWLAFGNLYYFFSDTENFVATNTTSVEGLVKEWDGDMHVTELQESTVLRNVPHFWELVPHKDSGGNEQLLPRTVNRLNGYLDCLYFSGVSILTIGYGDIVPESRFLKMLVLLEGFLGQFINVVAIGLWLSGVKGSDDLKKQ